MFKCLGKADKCLETLLGENVAVGMHGKATYTKVNQLRYDTFAQKYQGTSGQVLDAFDGIFYPLV